MTMTAEQLAQLREVADIADKYSVAPLWGKNPADMQRFLLLFTPAMAKSLLDELERKDKQAERLDFTYMNALELPDDASRNDILAGIHALRYSLNAANKRIAEMEAISSAAEKLVRCKGRYHSEQNYRALAALFGVTTPDLPPLESEARTVTVKLPDVERWRSVDAERAQNAYRVLVIKTLADAGINLTVEG